MSMAYGYGLGLTFGRGRVSSTPAYQQILDLAAADGWTAVYDPTNPNTLTVDGSNRTGSVADGLGTLADAVQATEANKPIWTDGAFGDLAGLTCDGTDFLDAGEIAIAQPFFIACVAKVTASPGYIFGVGSGSTLSLRRATTEFLARGSNDLSVGAVDDDPHVFGVLFNGASSITYRDGAQIATGDIGSSANAASLVLCARADQNLPLSGVKGPWAFYTGTPSGAVRTRMFDLLHDLSGIAKA